MCLSMLHRCVWPADAICLLQGRLLKAYSETATAVQDLRVGSLVSFAA